MIVDEDHLLEMVDIILTTKIRFYLKQKKNLWRKNNQNFYLR